MVARSMPQRSLAALVLLSVLLGLLALGTAAPPAQAVEDPDSSSAIFFAADGMRQDKVNDYVAGDSNAFGAFADLLTNGVDSGTGMISQAPPNTGSGWNTMATGDWVSEHGTTNNTFHKNGTPFGAGTSAFGSSSLTSETAAQAWEKAGKEVALVEWPGGRDLFAGPDVIGHASGHNRRKPVENT